MKRQYIFALLVSLTMNAVPMVSATSTPVQQVALNFVPVAPCRIADTRGNGFIGPFGPPFISGQTVRTIPISSSGCNIPNIAQAYSLNVTVAPHGALGFLTAFPCGQRQPPVSTLNSMDGRVKAASAIVPASTSGSMCFFVTNDTDLILDINGYFAPTSTINSLSFYPVTPCRIADTRAGSGFSGEFGPPSLTGNATGRSFQVLSSPCNLPATAQAYSLNYTALPKTGTLGFLTTWPTGQAQPLVSTLNAPTGTVTSNAAIVPAGTNGAVSVFVSNDVDLALDVNGYFAPPGAGGLSLFNLSPCRVLDTRNPPGAPPLHGEMNVNVMASGCGTPASAQAYVLNATVVPPGSLGFLSLWPQGEAQPQVSTLNAVDGAVTSNMALVATNNGSVSAFTSDPSHLILDISGYFAVGIPQATLLPSTLTFPATTVGSTNSAQMLTLTNSGNDILIIAGIGLGGTNPSNFSSTSNCGSSLFPGSSCIITVTFKPAFSTAYTASLTVTDNSGNVPGSTQSATITGAGAAQAGCQNIGVPMYFSPVVNSADWSTALHSTPIPGGKQLILIMNPNSGPGKQTDPDFSKYQTDVAIAHMNGIKVYGYVATGNGSIDSAVVHMQVMEYISWFGVDGIFLDQVQGDATYLGYYTGLVTDITTNLPGGGVWLNPGRYPDERYMNIPVPASSQLLVNVFENTYAVYLNPIDPIPSWINNYPGDRMTHIVHGTDATDLTNPLMLAIQRNAGWVYFTDDSDAGNPYARISKYWAELISRTRSACHP